eukprot:TRINITY_DN17304_c0_g2_i2.p1 TRINITY_DN17304_c0_g2~~TRINITY_DN17304_c0_g2_i2.p1  ORF type:complete len:248 (+),score=27.42 TRINITY_DN17304_c0_g2_i2:79-744(+)
MDDILECNVISLDGKRFCVQARYTWTVLDLKDHLCRTYDIPEYEIHFAKDAAKLKDTDSLVGLLRSPGSSRLVVLLYRSHMPPCFSHVILDRMWQMFQVFCNSDRETIDGTHAVRVIRFGGLFKTAALVASLRKVPRTFTFPELMDYVACYKRRHAIPFGREDDIDGAGESLKRIYVDELDVLRGTPGAPRQGDWEEAYGSDASDLSMDSASSDESEDNDW